MAEKVYQELSKLWQRAKLLECRLASQEVILAAHPMLRVGDPQTITDKAGKKVYRLKERTVTESLLNEYADVQLLPGDPGPAIAGGPVAFYLSDDGERYILPQSDRVILVQDLGSSTGKQVQIDTAGTVTTPANSETLGLLVAEPSSQFHNSTFPLVSGRIYPGQKIQSVDGATRKYLVFLQGFGAIGKTFDIAAGTDSFVLDLDTSGQVINFKGDVAADTGFIVRRTIDVITFGGESDYYCAMKIQTWSSGAGGFQPGIFARLYKSFSTVVDYTLGAFTDKICQNDKIAYYSNTESHIKTAGTGIPNKDSFFPEVDLYISPPQGYPQFYEFSTPVSRKSVLLNATKSSAYPVWFLAARAFWNGYNPNTDTASFSDIYTHVALDCGSLANAGWNDEATQYILYFTNSGTPKTGGLIPGWEILGNCWFYVFGQFQHNITVPYSEYKASNWAGGRVYATKLASAWKVWDFGTSAWRVGISPYPLGDGWWWAEGPAYSLRVGGGDEWKSKRKGGTTGVGTYGFHLQ